MIKLFNNINKSKSFLCRNDYLVKNLNSLNTNSMVSNKINFPNQTSNNNDNTNKTYITSFNNTTSKFNTNTNTNNNTNTIEEKGIDENDILELVKSNRFSSYYDKNLSMWGDLHQQSNSWYELLNTENGEKLSNLSILTECINKFPNYPNSYLILASFLSCNTQYIKILKQQAPPPSPSSPILITIKLLPLSLSSPPSIPSSSLIVIQKYHLVAKAYSIIRNDSKYTESDWAQCYIQFARVFGENEVVYFFGYKGLKKRFSKKQLYVKAIELIENKLIDIPINELLQIMTPREKIKINGKLHSIIDVSNFIPKNNDYLKKKLKKTYIESIQNGSKESIDYLNLSCLIEDDEMVNINVEASYGKVNLLLLAIHYGGKDSIEAYCQLSKQLPNLNSTIKLLNGTEKTKLEILMETLPYSPNSLFDYSIHLIDSNSSEDEIKNLEIIDCLTKVISMDPSFSLAYLKLGIQMQIYSIEECKLPIVSFEQQLQQQQFINIISDDFDFTRKQLFSKFLELSNTDFKLNENDILLGWYNLALEMDLNERELGKTKKEILLSIIDEDVSLSIEAHRELLKLYAYENGCEYRFDDETE
ncbi:hypothetical protein ACTFIW_000380 [Dictyostelium discoideum]